MKFKNNKHLFYNISAKQRIPQVITKYDTLAT